MRAPRALSVLPNTTAMSAHSFPRDFDSAARAYLWTLWCSPGRRLGIYWCPLSGSWLLMVGFWGSFVLSRAFLACLGFFGSRVFRAWTIFELFLGFYFQSHG